MKTTSSWHGVWALAVVVVAMVVAPLIATAGEQPERGAKPRPTPRTAPRQQRPDDLNIRSNARPTRRDAVSQRRTDRPPARNRVDRGPRDPATQPSPPRRDGRPPQGPLPEIARRMLAGSPMDLFSDVMAKLLSDVAVKLFSGNEAELLSGNETQLLSGNEPELLSGNEAELLSGNQTELLSGNEPEVLSGNRAEILSGNAVTMFSGNHLSITISNSGNHSGNQNEANTAAGKEFSALDKDRDGRLSFEEFRARKIDRIVRKAHKRFRRRDADADGTLSLREFALLQ
jgi:hypothetical protein